MAIETHTPVNQSENCVITPESDVLPGQKLCAALAHNDVTGHNHLAAEFFYTQAFADAVAPVFDAALTFLMCHK